MKANKYISRFVDTIDRLDQAGKHVPGLILSHAGFGKTSTLRKYCDYMNYNLITLIPSMYAADDILGLQSVKDGKLVRLTPSWFNKMKETIKNKKRTVLFIDEITTCDPYVQGPLLDLIFNGNLGEEHLPENVFIIAAGNYSEDLNNVFKMSDPLINRFMLLNLNNSDFSIKDLLTENFDQLKYDELGKFLGVSKTFSSLETHYDVDNFKKWLIDSDEIEFGITSSRELPEIGLLGFTSIRSLDNSIKFCEAYVEKYNDDLWLRIVGDTLGVSTRRSERPLRYLLQSYEDSFLVEGSIASDNTITNSTEQLKALLAKASLTANSSSYNPREVVTQIDSLLDDVNVEQLTGTEVTKIISFLNDFSLIIPAAGNVLNKFSQLLNKTMQA